MIARKRLVWIANAISSITKILAPGLNTLLLADYSAPQWVRKQVKAATTNRRLAVARVRRALIPRNLLTAEDHANVRMHIDARAFGKRGRHTTRHRKRAARTGIRWTVSAVCTATLEFAADLCTLAGGYLGAPENDVAANAACAVVITTVADNTHA